jgi:hypothetical protein
MQLVRQVVSTTINLSCRSSASFFTTTMGRGILATAAVTLAIFFMQPPFVLLFKIGLLGAFTALSVRKWEMKVRNIDVRFIAMVGLLFVNVFFAIPSTALSIVIAMFIVRIALDSKNEQRAMAAMLEELNRLGNLMAGYSEEIRNQANDLQNNCSELEGSSSRFVSAAGSFYTLFGVVDINLDKAAQKILKKFNVLESALQIILSAEENKTKYQEIIDREAVYRNAQESSNAYQQQCRFLAGELAFVVKTLQDITREENVALKLGTVLVQKFQKELDKLLPLSMRLEQLRLGTKNCRQLH